MGRLRREVGNLTLEAMIHRMTDRPARRFGLTHRGRIEKGWFADLVVFDRSERWTPGPTTLQTLSAPSPLAGRPLPGLVLLTIANGRLAWAAPEA